MTKVTGAKSGRVDGGVGVGQGPDSRRVNLNATPKVREGLLALPNDPAWTERGEWDAARRRAFATNPQKELIRELDDLSLALAEACAEDAQERLRELREQIGGGR